MKDDIVSIDGKCMRRTLDKVLGASAIHLVSAWSAKNNLCFGQIKVDEKSNEITAIPLLLDLLDLKDATVTMDAMGCQFAITDKIVDCQANYVLALKGSQGEFHDDIKLFLDTNLVSEFEKLSHTVSKKSNGEHGRIEQRNVWLTDDVQWLIERHPRWKSLRGIAIVDSTREVQGKVSREQRLYITSHENKDADFIANAIRSHWFVENKLRAVVA